MDDEKILNASALSYLDQLDESRYPRTKAEAEEMSAVLQQAYDAADNAKDKEFAERYQTLRGIADWSTRSSPLLPALHPGSGYCPHLGFAHCEMRGSSHPSPAAPRSAVPCRLWSSRPATIPCV